MADIRENAALESWKAMLAIQAESAAREQKKINEAAQKINDKRNNIINIIESRKENFEAHGNLLESCKNNELSKAIKAIYITALEANTLTDNGIFLAENMVDSWIKEKGGATNIFRECSGKTYFLDRLQQIVEDAAEEDVKDIEKDESGDSEDEDDKSSKKEDESKDESKSDDSTDTEDKESKEDTDDKDSKDDSDDSTENTENNDDNSDDESENTDNLNDSLNDTFDDVDDYGTDDEEDDSDIEIVDDDEEDEEDDLDSDGESHGKVFDELEKEEDVKKAISLIRQRVADAEETFIKRNAEDKKQIDELLGRISDNIKTVKDMDEDSEEAKIAQENASLTRRRINNITESRPLSIFEKMTRTLSPNIIKNEALKEQFTEDGKIDFGSIVESSKVMYAFLETLNTLQLEKVDEAYITSILKDIH